MFFFMMGLVFLLFFFFFQAEDGIRDRDVTGVQTCALPISEHREAARRPAPGGHRRALVGLRDADVVRKPGLSRSGPRPGSGRTAGPELPGGAHSPTRATRRAASGPSVSSAVNPASSRIGTFSVTAFSYLDPGDSPTTTKSVFFDTLPLALPPRTLIASAASSREYPVRLPVTTMVIPSSGRGPASVRSSASRTPAARHFSTISRCQSTANHSLSDSATVGPTPSTPAISSAAAAAW